jgi:hypothetical protein
MHAQLPSSLTSENLRRVLVDLYTRVLRFLAQAIDSQPRNAVSRIAQQFWSPDSIQHFEQDCERLCEKAEQEASICDRETGARWRVRLEESLRSLKDVHSISDSLSSVHNKLDLSKLTYAKDATYDSSAEGSLPRCLAGTRVELLREILSWTTNQNGKRIFWLCGKAGIGKSTISRTIAGDLDKDGRLGASFFFKRGQADRSHANLFFPTIAKQLADKIPDMGSAIAAALEKDSLLCERHMTKQFDKLLLQPIQSGRVGDILPKECFIVVDALDECEDVEQIEALLKLLARIEDIVAARVRLLVTSRPNLPLVMGFREMSNDLHQDVQVEEAQVPSIKSDLRIYFDHKLAQITSRFERRDAFSSLSAGWFEATDIDLLVDKSHPLFIVAFTICRLLSLSDKPQEDLNMLLTETSGHGVAGGLGSVYLPVLRQAVPIIGGQDVANQALRFRKIIGSLILLFNPLSALSLSNLLGTQLQDVGAFIVPLQSVLNVAKTAEGSVFWVDKTRGHRNIGDHCLRLLSNGALKEDVCGVQAPGTRRAAIERRTVDEHLSDEVAYACCYWIQHFVSGKEQIKDDGAVHRFLQKHVLHWIEALSWLGKTSDVIYNIAALRSLIDVSHNQVSVTTRHANI